MFSKLLTISATSALLVGVASAQGSNSCSGAQIISGTGTWTVDTAGATTDGPVPSCANGQAYNDVWFEWTPSTTDNYVVSTCPFSGFDTVMVVYDNTNCSSLSEYTCDDDFCGSNFQSQATFAATAGQTYLIRIGGWSSSTTGQTSIEITDGAPTSPCASPTSGPDVIVGELNGITTWGGSSGVSAYSIGTTSCNYGDTPLNWFSNTNQHPVIGQNIFRLKDGRFEQIGQGWLKHGFLALAQNLCCTCNNPGTGSLLGVGCSDPYGSSLNGQQSGLGPRSDINPSTGFYSYPYTAQGATGSVLYKRIRVSNSDLDPALNPGASYYGDGQYIAPDDAAAGNDANNVSWIDINVNSFSGGAWNLSLSGSTNREQPAIQAWLDADPGVTLTEVAVSGDGIFIIGSQAYDNGNGTWDYEYAVYNMNSDLAGGTFSVPTQVGTSVTGIGFHDCDSHSGEPYSNTDWTGVSGATDVSWATDSFAVNPNANAVRWGTLYNYRFTANAAPTTGNVTLGLFKNGAIELVGAKVPGTPSGGPTPPANDTCASPTAISGEGTFAYDTTDATSSGFNGGGGCTAPNQDVFLEWTCAQDGDYVFDTCVTGYNTRLALHSGAGCAASCIQSDNNSCGLQESIQVNGLMVGDVVLVQVGGTSTNEGPGTLTVTRQADPPPANDTCATPTSISGEGTFAYDSTFATTSGFNGLGGCSAPNQDVFLEWTCLDDGDYTFDTCLTSYDTILAAHNGAGCAATCAGSNDDSCGLQSEVDVLGLVAGDVVLVQVGGVGAAEGPGTLTVTKQVVPPPANDTCASGAGISGLGTFAYDTTNATSSGFAGALSGCNGTINQDVFFVWTAGSAGDFQFDTCATGYDTIMSVFDGVDCSALCIASNDDACGLQSTVTVVGLAAGDQVLVQVGGFGSNNGAGVLTVTDATPPPPPPANDTCATPDLITGEDSIAWNNEFATTSGFDGGDPATCMSPANGDTTALGQCQKDLFWHFVSPCDGDWQFDTNGSTGNDDTRLNIHVGSDCSATCLQSDDDGGTNFLSLSVVTGVQAGDSLLIQTGSWTSTSAAGEGLLNVTRVGGACPTFEVNILCDPANDHFQGNYAKLDASSFGSGVGSDLHLSATDGPTLQWGFFLVSAGGGTNLTVNSGILCLDAPTARYNIQVSSNQGLPQLNSICRFDASGDLENFAGTGVSGGGYGFDVPLELPYSPAGQTIQSGDTWYFQLWYRDQIVAPGDSSNFTNMVEAVFP